MTEESDPIQVVADSLKAQITSTEKSMEFRRAQIENFGVQIPPHIQLDLLVTLLIEHTIGPVEGVNGEPNLKRLEFDLEFRKKMIGLFDGVIKQAAQHQRNGLNSRG